MKRKLCLIAVGPLLLAACETEPIVTTTTTTTRQEVVRTQGDRVVGREVIVSRTPPAVQVEQQTVAPGSDYVWVPGNWVARPRTTAVYVQGEWQRRPGGWVWVPGRWQ
jgi:WXXGXW repeat (2 copies)